MSPRALLGLLGRGLLRLSLIGRKTSPPELARTAAIGRFAADPDSTYIVSFPRTGSHWLRMLMEKYFERPQLKLTYYYHDRSDFLTYHTHDMALDVVHPNVIYMYREPVSTVFSQMVYERSPISDRTWIRHWTELYGLHLVKWLHEERFTRRKTVICYERLQADSASEFARVAVHFGQTFDAARFAEISVDVTREEVGKQREETDPRVVDLSASYREGRKRFRDEQGAFIRDTLFRGREVLMPFFSGIGT